MPAATVDVRLYFLYSALRHFWRQCLISACIMAKINILTKGIFLLKGRAKRPDIALEECHFGPRNAVGVLCKQQCRTSTAATGTKVPGVDQQRILLKTSIKRICYVMIC